jgi:hypothetical protein
VFYMSVYLNNFILWHSGVELLRNVYSVIFSSHTTKWLPNRVIWAYLNYKVTAYRMGGIYVTQSFNARL